MVKFWAVKTIALESVDFFQKEWNCLEKHEGSDSMSRVVQQHYKRVDDKLIIMRTLKD